DGYGAGCNARKFFGIERPGQFRHAITVVLATVGLVLSQDDAAAAS
ncbi:MAG: hypothetical protein RLZZ327_578, partial [Actinomycetota bacterium]